MLSVTASPAKNAPQFWKGGTVPNFALPNGYHPPPQPLQRAIISAVACDVAAYLFPPELNPRLRPYRIMAPMVMPEAAVHLHYGIVSPQYDIRPARKTRVVQPEAKPTSVESPTHENFRTRVLVFYGRHVSTPPF